MTRTQTTDKTANSSAYGRVDGFTRHAQERFQQRGFSQAHIDIVLEFGKKKFRRRADGRGSAYVYSMDKRGRKIAESVMGKGYKRISDKLDIYIVESFATGKIITVAHRKQRLKW